MQIVLRAVDSLVRANVENVLRSGYRWVRATPYCLVHTPVPPSPPARR